MPNKECFPFKLAELIALTQTNLQINVAKSSKFLLLNKKIYNSICFCAYKKKF